MLSRPCPASISSCETAILRSRVRSRARSTRTSRQSKPIASPASSPSPRNYASTLNNKETHMTTEAFRLEETRQKQAHWQRWGPYLSERAWGTVREDYSSYGTAWEYFSHDQARSRAY